MTLRVLHLLASADATGSLEQAGAIDAALQSQGGHARRLILGRRPHTLRADEHFIPRSIEWDLRAARAVLVEVRQFAPDVLHVWLPVDDQPALSLAAWLLPRRWVASWRETPEPCAASRRPVRHRPERWIVPTAGLLRDALACGVEPARVRLVTDVLPPCVSRSPANPTSRIPDSARVILAAGRWSRADGGEELIWATDLLKVLREDVHLVLVGHGAGQTLLQRFRRQVEIADRVHLRPLDEWPHWLERAEIFWSARSDEGLSPELVQSATHGLQLVLSATHDHRALVERVGRGVLVPIGDRAGRAQCTLRLIDTNAPLCHEPVSLPELNMTASRSAVLDVYREVAASACT